LTLKVIVRADRRKWGCTFIYFDDQVSVVSERYMIKIVCILI
jgi:hypothetical protein